MIFDSEQTINSSQMHCPHFNKKFRNKANKNHGLSYPKRDPPRFHKNILRDFVR